LTIDASYRQIPHSKAFINASLTPSWPSKMIWSLPPVLKGAVQVSQRLLMNDGGTFLEPSFFANFGKFLHLRIASDLL
jgi:hypothetical protein